MFSSMITEKVENEGGESRYKSTLDVQRAPNQPVIHQTKGVHFSFFKRQENKTGSAP
jgi:hypothetical protein